jgi:hypothetical protein
LLLFLVEWKTFATLFFMLSCVLGGVEKKENFHFPLLSLPHSAAYELFTNEYFRLSHSQFSC